MQKAYFILKQTFIKRKRTAAFLDYVDPIRLKYFYDSSDVEKFGLEMEFDFRGRDTKDTKPTSPHRHRPP